MPPDLILWGTQFMRAGLAAMPETVCRGVEVSDAEPPVTSPNFPRKLVVVGDNGSSDGELVQAECSLRVVTICDSKRDVVELSRIVHAIWRGCARAVAGNPVAAVVGARGPMSAGEEQPRHRRMSVFDLSIVSEVRTV